MQKDAYYFPHFCNARSDRKLKRLRKELDIEGYGIYFMILEVLREQPDFKYPVEDLDLLADEFGTSEQKTRAVVLNYGLFEMNEEEEFFSIKLIEYLGPYLKSKESRRIGGIKGNLIKYGKLTKEQVRTMTDEEVELFNEGQKAAKLEEFSHTESVTESVTDRSSSQSKVNESKVNEIKEKESKSLKHTVPIEFIDLWNGTTGITNKSFRAESTKLKTYNQILARFKTFKESGFNEFFQNLSRSSHVFNEKWFTLDRCVKSDDNFQNVIDGWMEWKKNKTTGGESYDLTKLYNS